jgi:hypothetical protein
MNYLYYEKKPYFLFLRVQNTSKPIEHHKTLPLAIFCRSGNYCAHLSLSRFPSVIKQDRKPEALKLSFAHASSEGFSTTLHEKDVPEIILSSNIYLLLKLSE